MSAIRIEQQLTILFRRVQRIHLDTLQGAIGLERSAYGIMSRLADVGPLRLSALAQAFGLDPSTITRQVQAMEGARLVEREPDPSDRRATLLSLTELGAETLTRTRAVRRQAFAVALRDWSEAELEQFGDLLERFNASTARTEGT